MAPRHALKLPQRNVHPGGMAAEAPLGRPATLRGKELEHLVVAQLPGQGDRPAALLDLVQQADAGAVARHAGRLHKLPRRLGQQPPGQHKLLLWVAILMELIQ